MSATLILKGQTYIVPSGETLRQALSELEIPPHSVLALRDGKMMPEDAVLKEGDQVRLIYIIAGGAAPA